MVAVGIDFGSSATKVVANRQGSPLLEMVLQPGTGLLQVLHSVATEIPDLRTASFFLGITGSLAPEVAQDSGIVKQNEVLSLAWWLYNVQKTTALEVGAESARFVEVERTMGEGPIISRFAVSGPCASGTGSFIAKQASRVGLGIEDFDKIATKAQRAARLASRCAVFAKSDMIHLQQKGVPLEEIAYGLMVAMARNVLRSVLPEKDRPSEVAVVGGVARLKGFRRALETLLPQTGLTFFEKPEFCGALGAMEWARQKGRPVTLEDLKTAIFPAAKGSFLTLMPLGGPCQEKGDLGPSCETPSREGRLHGYLGIDVGSVSTDVAFIDENGTFIAGEYLRTAGRPVEAVAEGLQRLRRRLGDDVKVLGVGCTGSGRHLAATIVGADEVRNEITAQMKGALHYVPEVDTIFEIGGQDAKYIAVKDGKLLDFTMNKVCAAGTGSFLEEQAGEIGIDVTRDFAPLAQSARRPPNLGERCTVFMESAVTEALSDGFSREDVLAGLAYSVVKNYLSKVVGGRRIGKCVVFQGGVSKNEAVLRAFQNVLGRAVIRHPYGEFSGAIGAALLAKEKMEKEGGKTAFRGFDVNRHYESKSFECKECELRCEVVTMKVGGHAYHFGDACERYALKDGTRALGTPQKGELVDLVRKWEEIVQAYVGPSGSQKARVLLPRASVVMDLIPFFGTLLRALDFEVLLGPKTSKEVLDQVVASPFCLAAKAGLAHVGTLLDSRDAQIILVPSIVGIGSNDASEERLCAYSENLPFLEGLEGTKVKRPQIFISSNKELVRQSVKEIALALSLPERKVREAFLEALQAQSAYYRGLQELGEEVLRRVDDFAVLVLGRPYIVYDNYLNMALLRHLERLGVQAIPMDFLASDGQKGDMVWAFTSRALGAARKVKEAPNLFPLMVTCFGCGPDAFLQKRLLEVFSDRPFMVLELDEHRGEAGMITRLEAFLDQIKDYCGHRKGQRVSGVREAGKVATQWDPKTTKVYVPYFADHAYAFVGVLRARGIEATLLERPSEASLARGEELASGKECHAYAYLAGDLLSVVERSCGQRAIFMFPGTTIPCLLADFACGLTRDLERFKATNVEVVTPASKGFMDLLGMDGAADLWRGLLAVEAITRWRCATRPYEAVPGSTDMVADHCLVRLMDALEKGRFWEWVDEAARKMTMVAVRGERDRPLVGVAGDIYTRINAFANDNLFSTLEAMGCEVWPAPMLTDVLDFGIDFEFLASLKGARIKDALMMGILAVRKDFERFKVFRKLVPGLKTAEEPSMMEVLRSVRGLLGERTQEMVLLNVAKMLDFARRGADGVLNAMCFGCMVGNVSDAVAKVAKSSALKDIPFATLVYSPEGRHLVRTTLEAFVYQVHQRAAKRPRESLSLL